MLDRTAVYSVSQWVDTSVWKIFTESFSLEETHKIKSNRRLTLPSPPLNIHTFLKYLQEMATPPLPLGSLSQCLTIPSVNKFFLTCITESQNF